MKLKLEKFKEKDKKRKFIIIFTVCCILLLAGVFLYTSFAVLTEEKQFNVINGTYQDPGDLYFAVYVDGEITNTIPSKDSGYTLDMKKSSCTNGATVSWDNNAWQSKVIFSNYTKGNMSRTKCTLYFENQNFADAMITCNENAAECIINNANLTNELVDDDTTDHNLRFVGSPNNYIYFNCQDYNNPSSDTCELWRIIGVMNNIKTSSSSNNSLVKIIKSTPISAPSVSQFSFDYKSDGTSSNDYNSSILENLLNNGAYYNSTSGSYYNYQSMITVNFSNTGLKNDTTRNMLQEVVWNVGGFSSKDKTPASLYDNERGTEINTNHSYLYIGKLGLMYPSDYGLATNGGNTYPRETCINNIELSIWSDYSECYQNDWLYYSSDTEWVITPRTSSSGTSNFLLIGGNLHYASVDNAYCVRPAAYLSPSVKIIGGDGSVSNPFTLNI